MKSVFNKLFGQQKSKGSTIIELLIAVMVVGLIVTAVANAITNSIKNTGESRFRQNAAILGQQVIEYFRTQKNTLGIINLSNAYPSGEYCFSDINSYSNGQCGPLDTVTLAGTDFKREVTINSGGNGRRSPVGFQPPPTGDPYFLTLRVVVSWMDGAEQREIELVQEFEQDSGFID